MSRGLYYAGCHREGGAIGARTLTAAVALLVVGGCAQDPYEELADEGCELAEEAAAEFDAAGWSMERDLAQEDPGGRLPSYLMDPLVDGVDVDRLQAALEVADAGMERLRLIRTAEGLDWNRIDAKMKLECADELQVYEYTSRRFDRPPQPSG